MTPMPPPPPMEAPTGVGEPAGFWRRFGGVFIDGLVVGVVVEQGTHHELIAAQGLYTSLYGDWAESAAA